MAMGFAVQCLPPGIAAELTLEVVNSPQRRQRLPNFRFQLPYRQQVIFE
jgi:hypothetical protein